MQPEAALHSRTKRAIAGASHEQRGPLNQCTVTVTRNPLHIGPPEPSGAAVARGPRPAAVGGTMRYQNYASPQAMMTTEGMDHNTRNKVQAKAARHSRAKRAIAEASCKQRRSLIQCTVTVTCYRNVIQCTVTVTLSP